LKNAYLPHCAENRTARRMSIYESQFFFCALGIGTFLNSPDFWFISDRAVPCCQRMILNTNA
jgi:hypothetical protein